MDNSNLMDFKERIPHGDFKLPMNIYVGELSQNNFNVYLHWHNEMELIYIESGYGEVYIDMKFYSIKAGDIVIINKESLHYLVNKNNFILKYKAIIFDLSLLQNSFLDYCQINFINGLMKNELHIKHIISIDDLGHNDILCLVNKLIDTYEEGSFAFQLQIKGLFFCLFYELFNKDYIYRDVFPKNIESKRLNKIKDVITYINDNYKNNLSVKKLSQISGYSEYHFIRFFKSQTGKTCTNFINSLRVEKACSLLTNTDLSITDIAFEVGYEDVSYFIKTFKGILNSTPSTYRKFFNDKSK